jgi:CheY-like chemotaxis protein
MTMMGEKVKVLLVDDRPGIENTLQKALQANGIEAETYMCVAKGETSLDIDPPLPASWELQDFDLALVDLELMPAQDTRTVRPADLAGGHVVLPELRSRAPWLPVIGYSQLFNSQHVQATLPSGGAFGFDAHLPRQFLVSDDFTRAMWEQILACAGRRRDEYVLGIGSHGSPKVHISSPLQKDLEDRYKVGLSLLKRCFHFAQQITVERLEPGYSGAAVYRVYSQGEGDVSAGEGQWVWKISDTPFRLHEECQRHQAMMRAGLDFARAVPVLWRGVLVQQRIGCIAYHFAKGYNSAPRACDEMGEARVLRMIGHQLVGFYYSAGIQRRVVDKLVNDWFQWSLGEMGRVASNIGGAIDSELTSLLSGAGASVRCLWARVHGDLHLGNIMVNGDAARNNDVIFIDFARSNDGPVVLDLATLQVDLLIRYPSSHGRHLSLPAFLDQLGITGSLVFGEDDEALFITFTRLLLLRALKYPSVNADIKKWIRELLTHPYH